MTDILIYWRDYRQNWIRRFAGERAYHWHSNARLLSGLQPGDRLWFVTSGKNLRHEAEQEGFLVAVWHVQEVMDNPGDDPAYPKEDYRYRIVAAELEALEDKLIRVDHVVRPEGRDKAISIGRFLQGPRKLKDETIRLLHAVVGPIMARV